MFMLLMRLTFVLRSLLVTVISSKAGVELLTVMVSRNFVVALRVLLLTRQIMCMSLNITLEESRNLQVMAVLSLVGICHKLSVLLLIVKEMCIFQLANNTSPSDKTPPSIIVPNPMTAEATTPSGAIVSYQVTATDNVDGTITAVSNPPSGSIFPIGTTTVTCSATDKAGNTAKVTFTVTVKDT